MSKVDAPGRGAMWWVLVPFFSVGLLAAVPFGWLSGRVRRVRNIVIAALYAAAAVLALVFIPEDEAAADNWAVVMAACVWILGTAHTAVAMSALRRGDAGQERSVGQVNREVLRAAMEREELRRKARGLLVEHPVAAAEMRIGRPDLPRTYDDGGLVDVNTVPADVLVRHLGWSAEQAEEVVAVRERLGRFADGKELIAFTQLPPTRVDAARAVLVFSARLGVGA
ncbi:helix-hairpin-helix domain-containing protein [Streptomyces sp. NPDC041068]|uniref:helix-hairpin-helix domain-containing protein n=1 Tax=Streptomyces sp. NPDC041068 TaxID=3155130 RepID=UPI0033C93B6B